MGHKAPLRPPIPDKFPEWFWGDFQALLEGTFSKIIITVMPDMFLKITYFRKCPKLPKEHVECPARAGLVPLLGGPQGKVAAAYTGALSKGFRGGFRASLARAILKKTYFLSCQNVFETTGL